jgi:transcriptional regulator of acetoin/glycerol metabolism
MSDDFVSELVSVVNEVTPLQEAERARIADSIRHRFGGDRVWIRATVPVCERINVSQVAVALREKSVSTIAAEHGISRNTLYRLLKKRN